MRCFRLYIIFLPVIVVGQIFAQTPNISAVQRIVDFPLSRVQITGSGFSNTPAQLQVWFGTVKGNIISSSETLIEVEVPAQARLHQVEVINLSSRRSSKSSRKYMPKFSGEQPFVNNFAVTAFTNADDIFDICACDMDGDGKTDIVGTKFRDGKVNLMLLRNTSTVAANNSTLAFTQTSIPIAAPTFSIACGDLNGDGKPEVVVSRGGSSNAFRVFIFPNTSTVGTISFSAAVTLDLPNTTDQARELAIQDLDGDGRPEIVVTNGASNQLYIFKNNLSSATINADGFSRLPVSLIGITNSLALDVADFNGDGWADIAVSGNTSGTSVLILKNPANGTLTFSSIKSIAVTGSANINDIASADFNNDGLLDFVVADRGSSVNKAFVYINQGGDLVFQSVNANTGFSSPTAWGVDVGDMNGDGFADFVVGNRDFGNPQVNVFINSGAATPLFTASTIVTPKANWFVRIADFDGDAKPDIAVTSTNNVSSFSVDVWKNKNCHQPVILNENPLTICTGQNIELKAVPLPGVAYSWSTGGTGPSTTITTANAGVITLTAVGEGGACSKQTTITVNAGAATAPPVPTITAPDGVCAGNTLTLSSPTSATEYRWAGPNGFSSNAQNPPGIANASAINAGTYSLVVKNSTGCSSDPATKNIDVVQPAAFSISSSSGTDVACSGQSVTLSINPVTGYNYQWKKGGANIGGQTNASFTIPSVAVSDAASYTVLVSHQTITCSSETPAFVLKVVSAPVASFVTTPALICVGTSVSFNASASTFDNSANPLFAWTFGDGDTGSGQTTNHTYLASSASITASLTISYAGVAGCSNATTRNFAVSAATPPVISASPSVTEICSNGTEQVTLSVTGSFNSYQWSPGGSTNATLNVMQPGNYTVVTVDAGGCSGTSPVFVLDAKTENCSGDISPIDITVGKVFTPNNDGSNDFWQIVGIENYPDCTLNLFDGRGRRVYQVTGSAYPSNGWDGKVGGKEIPAGTYFYVFGCEGLKPINGSVLVVR